LIIFFIAGEGLLRYASWGRPNAQRQA